MRKWKALKTCESEGNCTCKPEDGCGKDCESRLIMFECNDRTCGIGDYCTNRRTAHFRQDKIHETLEIREVENQGYGIASKCCLPSGSMVMEYIGEVITEVERMSRWQEYTDKKLFYVLSLTGGLYIDATRKGNWARFANHSCEPNCRIERIVVDGEPRIIFVTVKGISPEDQITIPYDFDASSNPQVCKCGEKSCTGIIGLKAKKSQKRKESDDIGPSSKRRHQAGT
ncbi:hypothetical protein EDB81DRAFT_670149 [Dactylonectria macrodidyma]|uniref:Histone-lysine N-methyltransferase n=1 Tax=Dactylonectria macrodidyma TaxID=307937 RepID=A0A9P9D6R2_9HYPO|nr:hypothetical protein EDB81DRAFT_670149 [Dactylonectria macrodidyma]